MRLHVESDPVSGAGQAARSSRSCTRTTCPRAASILNRSAHSSAQRRPRLVAVSWIPTNSGLVQDVEAVGAVCEDAGVPYLVDACQAVGQIPIDVGASGATICRRRRASSCAGRGASASCTRRIERLLVVIYPLFVDMRGARWIEAERVRGERDGPAVRGLGIPVRAGARSGCGGAVRAGRRYRHRAGACVGAGRPTS